MIVSAVRGVAFWAAVGVLGWIVVGSVLGIGAALLEMAGWMP